MAEPEPSESECKRIEEAPRDSEKRYRELSAVDDLTQHYDSGIFIGNAGWRSIGWTAMGSL